ncbi:MAG: CNP1-like family protein [Pseudomonadota bacterium]
MQGAARFTNTRIGERRFFFARLLLTLLLSAAIHPLHAASDSYGMKKEYFDFDESKTEKWKESGITLPAWPRDENLLPVSLLATDTLKIYIDRASLSRGPDRVTRFSLVVQSPSGARSVFYDGLRCETREYKTYAMGSPEQAFTPVKNPAWRPIPRPAANAFRYHLYRDYICDEHDSARMPEDVVRQLTR